MNVSSLFTRHYDWIWSMLATFRLKITFVYALYFPPLSSIIALINVEKFTKEYYKTIWYFSIYQEMCIFRTCTAMHTALPVRRNSKAHLTPIGNKSLSDSSKQSNTEDTQSLGHTRPFPSLSNSDWDQADFSPYHTRLCLSLSHLSSTLSSVELTSQTI